jgi:DNA (cytosine-5)-methyltransferase 1
MKLGELFAGYGGLGLAVEEVFGAELAWVSEWESAPSKILAHHWPNVPNYGDVTKIDWANIEPVDIISGGSPCQDLSLAGKRRGMQDGTRSNLWESMREGIATIRPQYVVWENVRGALSAEAVSEMEQSEGRLGDGGGSNLRAIGRVLGDLSDLGYDAEWRGLRAADVGACHARFRVFILAANRDDIGHEWAGRARGGWAGSKNSRFPPPNASRHRLHRDAEPNGEPKANSEVGQRRRHSHGLGLDPARLGAGRYDATVGEEAWGSYGLAIHRWESALGRRAPAPTEPSARGDGHRLSPRFTEWMMGLLDGWVTDPDIGISRNDQLKACGNGVVPQQAIAALSDMLAAFQEKELAA